MTGGIPTEASGAAKAESAFNGCIRPFSTARLGSPGCWVRAGATDGTSVCLSRELWSSWLRSRSSDLCGNFSGGWKAVSYPRDEPSLAQTPKPIEFRFRARSIRIASAHADSGLDGNLSRLWKSIEKKREALSASLEPLDRWGVLRSLALDERSPEGGIGMLRALGFVHLQSATGIHLYALASLWRRLGAWLGLWMGLSAGAATRLSRAGAAAAWLYAWLLCGARAGMLRPLLLVSARILAESAGFRWRRWSPLALALALDFAAALFRPASQFTGHGRLFYALAVGGGMMAIDRRDDRPVPVWRQHLALAAGSWVLVALWEIWETGLTAPLTPLWSVATIPLYGLWVYPCLLLHSLTGWEAATIPLAAAERILEAMIRLSAALPSIWVVDRAALAGGAIAASVVVFALRAFEGRGKLSRRPASWRLPALAALLALAARPAIGWTRSWGERLNERKTSSFRSGPVASVVEQLDVGQGDSAWVRATSPLGGAGLIDTGPEKALKPEKWLALLGRRGIADGLDWVALTHLDEDHAGGLRRLSDLLPIGCVTTSREEIRSERGQKLKRLLDSRGIPLLPWESDCFPYPAMGPRGGREKKSKAGNARMSAVFVPLGAGGGYLSAGDADREDELRFARWFASLRAGGSGPWVLKLSHHGSRFSSAREFLEAARPTEAWVSSGVGNRYGHPAVQTTALLQSLGIPLRRTDRDGTLRMEVPLRAEAFRRRRRKRPP